MLYTQQQQHQQLLQQHQQQQQQQQLQQQQAQSTNGGTDAQSLSNSGPEKEMNLAGVLHYLQSEWRRWERDRNEWEIERAVMRARIAQLEGQRKSAENLKVDLLKRVKLLEHALRTERAASRMSGGTFGRSALPPSRLAALQDEDGKSRDEKESNASEGSDEADNLDRPKINGTSGSGVNGTPSLAMPMSRAATVALRQNADGNPWKNVGTASRDPKSRARSREYLKQCLQEITYLTSPGALNPLSPRPPISFDSLAPEDQSGPSGDDRKPPSVLISPPDRPQKLLPENPPPSLLSLVKEDTKDVPLVPNGISNGGPREVNVKQERPPSPLAANLREDTKEEEAMHDIPLGGVDERNPPSSPAVQTMSLPDPDQTEEGTHLLTAIYRPDSKAAWREELRAANEQAEKAQISRVKPTPLDDDQLSSISFTSTDEDIMLSEGLDKSFHGRRTLKSHLDIVRSVSFAHGPHIVLASGGDDCTVKIWSIETTSIMTGHRPPSELEPIVTFRGHTAPITSVLISSMSKPTGLVFSGSMDSTIRVWRLPPGNHDPYAPYDPNMSVQTLESHGEAVWDLCLLPCADIKGKNRGDVRLASASADGSVKIWELQESDGKELWVPVDSLKTWGKVPTTVEMLNEQFGKLLIGLDTGEAQVWDIDSSPARCERTFGEETLSTDKADGQINGILSHPTLPLVVTASEDGRLRFYDTQSGNMTHNILAHPSPLTSIILSPLSPMSLITSSTDCTMRVWDIAKKTSLQDLIGHRQRSDEGVCGMAGHPELPVLASAGADGVVRVWAAV
ncbi:hypothetical protein TREMEDRAFT_29277 [Tremella mesenterica DSM 1558]|uniref:uncharacterized protein n=1 Tax=Tremella mesenterica (strain ATCC 24925 / CBS 8224 / DSM 1558 / NBRC 9311 / NRRL Y-6157 / RJB 2259-6 / UBC 559-6) TaxID=578456 RepID=UPI0003F4A1C6|nr:uncharacterized protein TREMEDRAFT_29277 [Tremella mesenterica DSM 1558]EIW70885.1 hypothetical protein TREMEDRAFT_29277 [Tremella mesenterica DSM 1558]